MKLVLNYEGQVLLYTEEPTFQAITAFIQKELQL